MGPIGFATEAKSWMTIWRGYTQFSITIDSTRVKGTRFGKDLLQQIELCRGCPLGKYGMLTDPLNLIYMQCLPLFGKAGTTDIGSLAHLQSRACRRRQERRNTYRRRGQVSLYAFFFHLSYAHHGLAGIMQNDLSFPGIQYLDSTQQR